MKKLSKIIQDYLDGEKVNSSKRIINQIMSKLLESGFSPPFKISSVLPNGEHTYTWEDSDNDVFLIEKEVTEENIAEIVSEHLLDDVSIVEEDQGIGEYEFWGQLYVDKQIVSTPNPESIDINFTKLKDKDLIPFRIKINDVIYMQTGTSVKGDSVIAYYSGEII